MNHPALTIPTSPLTAAALTRLAAAPPDFGNAAIDAAFAIVNAIRLDADELAVARLLAGQMRVAYDLGVERTRLAVQLAEAVADDSGPRSWACGSCPDGAATST